MIIIYALAKLELQEYHLFNVILCLYVCLHVFSAIIKPDFLLVFEFIKLALRIV